MNNFTKDYVEHEELIKPQFDAMWDWYVKTFRVEEEISRPSYNHLSLILFPEPRVETRLYDTHKCKYLCPIFEDEYDDPYELIGELIGKFIDVYDVFLSDDY